MIAPITVYLPALPLPRDEPAPPPLPVAVPIAHAPPARRMRVVKAVRSARWHPRLRMLGAVRYVYGVLDLYVGPRDGEP